jgi:hypothetical protein
VVVPSTFAALSFGATCWNLWFLQVPNIRYQKQMLGSSFVLEARPMQVWSLASPVASHVMPVSAVKSCNQRERQLNRAKLTNLTPVRRAHSSTTSIASRSRKKSPNQTVSRRLCRPSWKGRDHTQAMSGGCANSMGPLSGTALRQRESVHQCI